MWKLLQQTHEHAVILLDVQETIIGWFAAAESMFGYADSEILGREFGTLFIAEDVASGVPAHELTTARHVGHSEDDRWHARKDGSRFWGSGAVTALKNEAGELVGFSKVLRDRTDLRQHQESFENRIETLEGQVGMAKATLGVLAHEFRGPLGAIANATQALRIAPAVTTPLDVISRQVAFLTRFVGDLLDSVRVDTGKLPLRKERVAIQEILMGACEHCRPAAEQRQQTLEALLFPTPLLVLVDPERIHQAVVNLIENAIKYTPSGGSIWLKCSTEANEVLVRVQDTGAGIEPAALSRVFELFTQEDSTNSMASGGIGVGLYLVKQLVSLHGGTVQVRSEGAGSGAEFTIRLRIENQGLPT